MTTEERFNRIESNLDRATNTLAIAVDTQLHIDGIMATLADSHIKLAEEQAETSRRFRAFEARMEELRRQFEAYLSKRPQ